MQTVSGEKKPDQFVFVIQDSAATVAPVTEVAFIVLGRLNDKLVDEPCRPAVIGHVGDAGDSDDVSFGITGRPPHFVDA